MADPSRFLVWSGELIDAGKSTSGENMYIRLADSPGIPQPVQIFFSLQVIINIVSPVLVELFT
jgi:hypothetical protein